MSQSDSPQKSNSGGKVTGIFKKIFNKEEQTLKSEIREMIDERASQGEALTPESKIFRNVLKFGDLRVSDIMTPRSKICAVEDNISLSDLKIYITQENHTRLPVYNENLDNILGFIHTKDLINYWVSSKEFRIAEILRGIPFVAPSMKLYNLLKKMQAERTHMAIVVDEHGGTYGLVTIEDVMEVIVGEINDEHDEAKTSVFKLADNIFEADANIPLYKLENFLGKRLSDEDADFDTLGGLIFTKLGKVPKIGDTLQDNNGLIFKVTDADKRSIKRVKIYI
jgi:magnesium and cobalt transporter